MSKQERDTRFTPNRKRPAGRRWTFARLNQATLDRIDAEAAKWRISRSCAIERLVARAAASESGNDAITNRHVLPLDGELVGRIGRFRIPQDETGRADDGLADYIEWYVVASGCTALGAERMREIAADAAMHRDGNPVRVLSPFGEPDGKRRLTYADIDGLAGAVLAELARLWKCGREDALGRCVPKTEAGLAMLADGFEKSNPAPTVVRRKAGKEVS